MKTERPNRFSKTNQVIACRKCGRPTTAYCGGTFGVDCCPECLAEVDMMRAHEDGEHEGTSMNDDCRLCVLASCARLNSKKRHLRSVAR